MAADADQGEVKKEMSGAEMADRLEAEEAARKLEEDKTTEQEEQLAADLAAAVGLPGDEEEAEEEEEKDEEPEGFVIEDDADEGGWNPDDMQSLQEDVARTIMGNSSSSSLIALCKVCGKNNAMKNQVFCSSPCGADVRGATRQAKDQGPEAFKAFKALRKSNPDEFVAAIHIFRAKCASAGRGHKRPEFQWVRYHMAIMLASRLQTGSKSIWMTKFAYANFKKIEEGMTELESFAQFEREVNMLPAGRVSQDKTKVLMPIEQFVISLEGKTQEEVVSYGTKDRASVRE